MPSTAISAQGSTVSIGTATGSALTITAVALTNPCRVTLASITALNKGDVITIAGVVGTTQLNGNSYVVQYIETATKIVTLAGLDSTGFTTYTSGGTATPVQWT
ncbi:MAG: phage tail protein, partial [Betaproteobacteria bacterium]|nr:phage tail protein [Betaproteobacteria bacterium]